MSERSDREVRENGVRTERVSDKVIPDNFVWIFGTGRSGSTWVSRMIRDLRGYSLWNEPLVGHMLGSLYHDRGAALHHSPQFLFGGEKDVWLPPVREFLLSAATAKYPHHAGEPERFLVVKEPHGSIGADLISEALPESRFVVLLRDPRDVVSSKVDAHKPGNWARTARRQTATFRADTDPNLSVSNKAIGFMQDMEDAFRGYERHPGPKAIVRYEDFRSEPEVHLRKLMDDLDLPVRRKDDLAAIVENHSWENIPKDQKGTGKIRRKARPGGFNEDLTPEQIRIVEETTATFLGNYYPETFSG